MKLVSFLYLTQLEEYEIPRIKSWLSQHPDTDVPQIKKQLIWTPKIKTLNIIAKTLSFLPSEKSVIFGLYLLSPFDWLTKQLVVAAAFLKLRLFHRHLTIIAITGSWGKTTSKDTLLELIRSKFLTSATTGNHNTLLGVCMDILKLPINTQYFIAEVGAYYPGDIAKVCRIIQPKYGIVTAVGPMHLERFGSIENVLNTKMELPQSVNKLGWIYLPEDQKQKIFHIRLKTTNILFFKTINEVYQHICRLLNINNQIISETLSHHAASEHRLSISTNNGITIIDDTYNSNPAGFKLALDTLNKIKSTNKILITPGMIELGVLQSSENTRLAKLASSICQHIIVVGNTNKEALLLGLKNTSAKIHMVNQVSDTLTLLPTLTTPGAAVLFENDLPDNYL